MEHREKLRTIFPYVLGAVTPEMLARRWEIDQLSRELRRKERELDGQKRTSAQWRAEAQNWVAEARDLGLLSAGFTANDENDERLLTALDEVVKKTSADAEVTDTALEAAAIERSELEREEGEVALQLAEVKTRAENMKRLQSAVDDYTGALKKQRERLHLSRWLRDLSEANQASCPVCGSSLQQAEHEIDTLCDALASIEATARQMDPVPAVFDRELSQVRDCQRAAKLIRLGAAKLIR
jgi:DNA repair exonuclease SbcCD ATPase subunit